ncbi:MAG: BofC C-terminal domain-containing protein [Negativicutes bacterium]|nr:BofC C-terminal domain-containing protein [Negativicutes bacterium]
MLPSFIKKKLGILAAFTLLALSATAHHYLYQEPQKTAPYVKQSAEAEVAKQELKIKILATTDLLQRIIYLKCGDEEVFRTKPAANLVGLNYQQVQKIYAGWAIDKFDTNEVEMTLKVDSYCREHANNMFLGIKDGYIAIYYGKPGPKAIVKEVTNIPVNKLMPQDVEELRRGLEVQSREELLRTLEGMQSR